MQPLPFRLARPLRTARLILRAAVAGDLDAMLRFHGREDVVRWLYWGPRSHAETVEALEKMRGRTVLERDGDALAFAIVDATTGVFFGECVLALASVAHEQGEVGYMLDPDHQGRGYATEATAALLGVAFDEVGLHRVVGRVEARHTASCRVLERVGMRREATLVENEFVKGEWQSEAVYAMLAREWAERPAASG